MELQTKTPKEVAQAIQDDLLARSLTIAEAARMLGKTPQSLYNLLRGEFRVGIKMAKALHDTFGYSRAFLQQGIGELIDQPNEAQAEEPHEDSMMYYYGVYYADDSLFTEREKLLNMVSRVLSETFSMLNSRLLLGIKLDLFDYDDWEELGFEPRSDVEKRLVKTISQYSSQIRQMTDVKGILNSKRLKDLG